MTIHLPDNCLAWSKGKPGPGTIVWKQLQCIILLLWCKMFCLREHETQGLNSRLKSDPWWRLMWLESVEKEATCMSEVLCHCVVGTPQAVTQVNPPVWFRQLSSPRKCGQASGVLVSSNYLGCMGLFCCVMWCPWPCPLLAFSSGAVSCVPCCRVGCPWSCDRSWKPQEWKPEWAK